MFQFMKVANYWRSTSLVVLICGLCSATAQQQDATELANKLVKVTRAWSDGELSTQGTTVEVREVARRIQQGGTMVQYHFLVKGASQDQTYTSVTWPINAASPSESLRGLSLSPDGLVICAGRTPEQCGSSTQKDDPVEFTFVPEKGEPYRLAFVSGDGKTKIFFTIIPEPITGKDKGCTLEAVRLMPRFETAMIRGKGFAPNEDLNFSSKSSGEGQESQLKADSNGQFVSALLPFVKHQSSGKTQVEVKGKECMPKVSFTWGE
jgi:hypothetical protein